ncbi:hypothetical protein EV03_0695 [Prochlorococcus marinus str. PAC1]|uniref:Uncharacterized protein n=1 Tax=Prochlorococcus marinus str. PAC1 TaxID=59924 RepID=A0A0A2C6Q6_PROMR|nr:hypothetical protein EV03_0695 [Prochlorococcus marinus str. PAC1]
MTFWVNKNKRSARRNSLYSVVTVKSYISTSMQNLLEVYKEITTYYLS